MTAYLVTVNRREAWSHNKEMPIIHGVWEDTNEIWIGSPVIILNALRAQTAAFQKEVIEERQETEEVILLNAVAIDETDLSSIDRSLWTVREVK